MGANLLAGAVEGHGHEADESSRRSDGHLGEEPHGRLDRSVSGGGATATLATGADVPDDYEQDAQKEGRRGRSRQRTERSQTELACRAVIHATSNWSLHDEQKVLEQANRRTQGEGREPRRDEGGGKQAQRR